MRIKLIGLRNDVRNMFAIGSIKEDYLGYGVFESPNLLIYLLTMELYQNTLNCVPRISDSKFSAPRFFLPTRHRLISIPG